MESIISIKKEKCFKILEKYLEETCKNKKKIKELIKHTERVLKICKKIINCFDINDKYTKKIIYRSAIFHDIGKFKYGEEHNKKAKEVLDKILKEKEESKYGDLEKIYLIIKYHRNEFEPDEDIAIPSAILRIADKIDKINKNKFDEFVDTYTSSMRKIKKNFKENNINDYEKLREACEIVKIQTIIKNI
ncbi:hypothetical protein HMPREF9629_00416 [Peptoanaerobacter stomatis]|uniref:HD domain-containing protein n=1 Tax=Peptoanaerobacter stomatis TaxID=796937 RepID=G9X1Z3_9FIRM|nr:HD domain-containing protein [Peptoanaerobacter stomatis]EHL13116.1 hypothetical protein HMPREF9629_00416 [Peptoanaerobacter stomatis]